MSGPRPARDLHPGAWWLWAMGLATAATVMTNPFLLLLIVGVAALTVSLRRSDHPWSRSFRLYLVFGLVIVCVRVVFRVLSMIMWVAPIGAFGAIAAVVGATGWSAIAALGQIMLGFYVTCGLFIVIVLGAIAVIAVVLGFFIADTIDNAPETFAAIVGAGAVAVVLDAVFRKPLTRKEL